MEIEMKFMMKIMQSRFLSHPPLPPRLVVVFTDE